MKPAIEYVRKNPGLSTSELARRLDRDRGTLREELHATCHLVANGQLTSWFATKAEAKAAAAQPKTAPLAPVERMQAESRNARFEREHRELTAEVARLREVVSVRDALAKSRPLKPIVRRERASGLREATAVALASDWHVEERVLATSTPTGNAYNLAIAEFRIERFFQGVANMVKKERSAFKIRDLQLWYGGDLVSGHIHDENVETSAFAPIAACLWLQPRLEAGIHFLLAELGLDNLQLVCSYGNHGRDTKKPRRATGAHHSYEWNMFKQIERNFAGEKRVSVDASPSGHQYTQIYDFTSHYHHGDEISYGGGVGGITIPINKAVAQWDKARRCDFHNFGHFHQYLNMGNIANNGSLIGFNAYAMSIKASPEPPQQAFYLVDSKRGKTCCSPIWAGDVAEEAKFSEAA
jgi:hypothetical protein